MRISDWSSDVCSSDLTAVGAEHESASAGLGITHRGVCMPPEAMRNLSERWSLTALLDDLAARGDAPALLTVAGERTEAVSAATLAREARQLDAGLVAAGVARSEEHTSAIQSLMRISYAVFCLQHQNRLN